VTTARCGICAKRIVPWNSEHWRDMDECGCQAGPKGRLLKTFFEWDEMRTECPDGAVMVVREQLLARAPSKIGYCESCRMPWETCYCAAHSVTWVPVNSVAVFCEEVVP